MMLTTMPVIHLSTAAVRIPGDVKIYQEVTFLNTNIRVISMRHMSEEQIYTQTSLARKVECLC